MIFKLLTICSLLNTNDDQVICHVQLNIPKQIWQRSVFGASSKIYHQEIVSPRCNSTMLSRRKPLFTAKFSDMKFAEKLLPFPQSRRYDPSGRHRALLSLSNEPRIGQDAS